MLFLNQTLLIFKMLQSSMKSNGLGKLNSNKIKFMVEDGWIEEPFELADIGNYLTTIPMDKNKKDLIASFERMRKKYLYAYEVTEPLKIFECISRNPTRYGFSVEKDSYDRFVFTNYELRDYGAIELQPKWFDTEILEICLDSMEGKGISESVFDLLKAQIHNYNNISNEIHIPERVKNQLEMRYLFYDNQSNPYDLDSRSNQNKRRMDFVRDDMIFDEILEHFKIDRFFFTNKGKRPKADDGLFRKELAHLKKYLALAYIYDKGRYPHMDEEANSHPLYYKKHLREFLAEPENYYLFADLARFLIIPYKRYELLDVHSAEYKSIFKYFREKRKFSKWQTQQIMKRYLSIIEKMQMEIPKVILDLVDEFNHTFDFSNIYDYIVRVEDHGLYGQRVMSEILDEIEKLERKN